jgi:uncharacterized membrane protein
MSSTSQRIVWVYVTFTISYIIASIILGYVMDDERQNNWIGQNGILFTTTWIYFILCLVILIIILTRYVPFIFMDIRRTCNHAHNTVNKLSLDIRELLG